MAGTRISNILALAIIPALSACSPSQPVATLTPGISQPPVATSMPVSPTTPAIPAPGVSVTIDLVAQNFAFNMSTISVAAGANVTVNFINMDVISHNFAVYKTLPGGQADPVFVGDTIGKGNITYNFNAPSEAGDYFYECDVHPQFMNGPFVVKLP